MIDEPKGKGMEESRLKRIEDKLDDMSKALTELIRLDERMVTLFRRMDLYDQRQERISDRIAALERSGNQVAILPTLVDRVSALETVNHRRSPFFDLAKAAGFAMAGAAATIFAKFMFGC